MRKFDQFSIAIDSNEATHGKTWVFPRSYTTTVRNLVKYGCDYSIAGQVGVIGIERKSYNDYVRCLGKDWPRFERQLNKLQKHKYYALVVEANINSPIYEASYLTYENIITRTVDVVMKGVPVLFAGNRHHAAFLCLQFFKAAMRKLRDE